MSEQRTSQRRSAARDRRTGRARRCAMVAWALLMAPSCSLQGPADGALPRGGPGAEADHGSGGGGEAETREFGVLPAGGEGGAAPGSGGGPPHESCTYLSDLPITAVRNIRGDGPYLDASGWDPHHDAEGYKPIEIDGVSYDKGVAWFGNHGQVSWLEWSLPGQQQRVRFVVRIDDEKYGKYEWGLVARSSGEVILGAAKARPLLPGGDPETGEKGDFRAPEEDAYGPNEALVRIGAGGKLRIFGDGALLHETTEFYAYGAGVAVDLDVSGVELLRISFVPRHHEQAAAPHRKGLTITPFLVQSSFFDIVDLAAAQVCE